MTSATEMVDRASMKEAVLGLRSLKMRGDVHGRHTTGLARPDRIMIGHHVLDEGDVMRLDPFTVEVIRHALTAAAEEMRLVMTRRRARRCCARPVTCRLRSPIHKGDLVGQGRDIPIHLGAMAYTVPELLEVLPASA